MNTVLSRIMTLLEILNCALMIVPPWIPFTLEEAVSMGILLFSWIVCHIVSDNDPDLPSLSSFTVDNDSVVLGSFYFLPSLRLASCCCCIPLWIDLPSLRAIRLNGESFCCPSHVEFMSEETGMEWWIRSSLLGVVMSFCPLPLGQCKWQENRRQLGIVEF